MEKIVTVPEGVNAEISNLMITISGEKGTLEKDFIHPLPAI